MPEKKRKGTAAATVSSPATKRSKKIDIEEPIDSIVTTTTSTTRKSTRTSVLSSKAKDAAEVVKKATAATPKVPKAKATKTVAAEEEGAVTVKHVVGDKEVKATTVEKKEKAGKAKSRKRAIDYLSDEEKDEKKEDGEKEKVNDKKKRVEAPATKKPQAKAAEPEKTDGDESEDGGWDALQNGAGKKGKKAGKAAPATKKEPVKPIAKAAESKKSEKVAPEPAAPKAPAATKKAKGKVAPPKPASDDEISLGGDSDSDVSFDEAEAAIKKAISTASNGDADPNDSGSEDEEEDDQTTALLKGFESSDEEDDDEEVKALTEGRDFKNLSIPDVKNKIAKQKKGRSSETPGYIYLGRIPHGFYESEMRSYFSQFGTLLRLRLSRNKKTGRSKHYAFLEFASSDVARIVAETMDNYLLFGHILKCKVIEAKNIEDVERLFKGANKKFKKVPWNAITRREVEKKRTREEWESLEKREMGRREKKKRKLEELGIDYDVPMAGMGTLITEAAPTPAAALPVIKDKPVVAATELAPKITNKKEKKQPSKDKEQPEEVLESVNVSKEASTIEAAGSAPSIPEPPSKSKRGKKAAPAAESTSAPPAKEPKAKATTTKKRGKGKASEEKTEEPATAVPVTEEKEEEVAEAPPAAQKKEKKKPAAAPKKTAAAPKAKAKATAKATSKADKGDEAIAAQEDDRDEEEPAATAVPKTKVKTKAAAAVPKKAPATAKKMGRKAAK